MDLRNQGPALTIDEISAFEQEIGGRLPDDYKRFLLATNGGMTEPERGLRWNGRINTIPGFDSLVPAPDSGLRRALSNLRELNVDGYLPFTSTLNEEDICLAFKDKVGTVWLALYAYDNDIAVSATLIPLADSFTDFLEMLFVIPEVYCPVAELGEHGTPADLAEYLTEGNWIDAVGKNDLTIVCEAIKFDNRPMIEACLQHGASLSKTIHMAVENRHPDLVQRFVDAGADVNEPDEYGDRPLRYVPGTLLPGEEGARNRAMEALLLKLGAVK